MSARPQGVVAQLQGQLELERQLVHEVGHRDGQQRELFLLGMVSES